MAVTGTLAFRTETVHFDSHESTSDIVLEHEIRFDSKILVNPDDEPVVDVALKGWNLEARDGNGASSEYLFGNAKVSVSVISVSGRVLKAQVKARLRPRDAGLPYEFSGSVDILAIAWCSMTASGG